MITEVRYTISKYLDQDSVDNYSFLRKEGMKYIEALCHKVWTDYNVHDPGVTMLEVLCYALSDLAYRMDFPIEDLIAEENDNYAAMHKKFHSAISILPNCPFSPYDYRKVFVDLDGIKNAWLEIFPKRVHVDCKTPNPADDGHHGSLSYKEPNVPANEKTFFDLQGMYRVLIELDENNNDEAAAIKAVTDRYHKHRNLCEDLIEVKVVDVQEVRVCAAIQLDPEAKAEVVDARIRLVLQDYLTPSVSFYSLSEMQKKGFTSDELFEGPVLDHGFIIDEELRQSELRTEVRLSDIINLIMDIDGIRLINDITIGFCDSEDPLPDQQVWLLCIKKGHQPKLCSKSVFNYYKDILPIEVDRTVAQEELDQLLKERADAIQKKTAEDIPMPLGVYREIGAYETVQNEFPDTYGINANGLPSHVSLKRRAQANQLKAFLLFFDQILAQYFAHLSKVKILLHADDSIRKTYFNQIVKGIKDGDNLYKNAANKGTELEKLTEDLDDYVSRKNQFLDHQIARFAERFFEYSFLMRKLSGKNIEDSIIKNKVDFLNEYPEISSRRNCAYNICLDESGAWDTLNVSGFQHRVARLSGIRDFSRRDLTDVPYNILENTVGPDTTYTWEIFDNDNVVLLKGVRTFDSEEKARADMWSATDLATDNAHYAIIKSGPKFEIEIKDALQNSVARIEKEYDTEEDAASAIEEMIDFINEQMSVEGMFVVEHILLRPDLSDDDAGKELFMPVCVETDCTSCDPLDPYSFRMSVILPGWTGRFKDLSFRRFMDRLIRMETPAHILPRICWIGEEDMKEFERIYHDWLDFRFKNPKKQAPDDLLQEFINILNQIHTIYPEGILHDCDDEEDEEVSKEKIILGQTHLGKLKS